MDPLCWSKVSEHKQCFQFVFFLHLGQLQCALKCVDALYLEHSNTVNYINIFI